MKPIQTATVLFMAAIFSGAAAMAEGNWTLSLGGTYRTFGDIDFGSQAFVNTQDAHTGNGYVTGNFLPGGLPPNQLYLVNYFKGYNVGTDTATIHQVPFTGGSDDADAGRGLVLYACRDLCSPQDTRKLKLELSLQAVWADTNSLFSSAGVETVLTGTGAFGALPVLPATSVWGLGWTPSVLTNQQQNVVGTVSYRTDLAMYAFGAGLSRGFRAGTFGIKLAAGPELAVVDYEMTRRESVRFDDGTAVYSSRDRDSGVSLHAGAYLGVGVSVDITERLGVELGGRYDFIFNDLDTDFADVDLSGFSGELKLVYRF